MPSIPQIMGLAPSKLAILVISICLSFSLLVKLGNKPAFRPVSWTFETVPEYGLKSLENIQNSTLGFEKILALNLPERGDKRDALSLAASLTNITIDYVDGVKGESVVNKSLPLGQERRKFPEPMLGSWRAHMNAIRTIVEKRLSSALILEDDVDWDIRIKSQMQDFARGTRFLLNTTVDAATKSPYGDDWDVLWLGHCYDNIDKQDRRVYAVKGDPSVPAVSKLHMRNPELLRPWPDHTRVVHVVGQPICTFAYALSLRGAQKVLYALSVKELRGLFDNALSWWCTGKDQGARCLDAHPAYFNQHRAKGGKGKNSDNVADSPANDKAETTNIRWSTRINVERLLTGRTDYIDSYPDGPK